MRFIKVGQIIKLEDTNKNSILLQSCIEKIEKDRLYIKLPNDSSMIKEKFEEADELNCTLYTQFGIRLFTSVVLDVQDDCVVIDYNPNEYKLLERRGFIRMNIAIPAMLEYQGNYIRVRTVDLGGGGIRFFSREDLPINTYMNMKIILNSNDSFIRICGKILKTDDSKENEYLFLFDNIDENTRTKIIKKCIEEQSFQVREFLEENESGN